MRNHHLAAFTLVAVLVFLGPACRKPRANHASGAPVTTAIRPLRQQTDSLGFLWRRERVTSRIVERLQTESAATRHRTGTAAALLLLGLLVEILGGTMLAGAHLSARQERITTLRTSRPLTDLAISDERHESLVNFFGTIGGALLVFGFLFQVAGTVVVPSLPVIRLPITVIALVVPLLLFWYFLGLTPEQSRGTKLRVLAYNIRRHFWLPAIRRMSDAEAVECEVCLRPVPLDRLQVWWLYEANSGESPYSHERYAYHYGHERCLRSCEDYGVYFDVPGKYAGLCLGEAAATVFVEITVPQSRVWYIEYHRDWTRRIGRPSHVTAAEERMNRVYDRVVQAVQRYDGERQGHHA